MPGQSAPQPLEMMGPRQGSPRETMTQTVPARLHSTQTASLGSCGRRPMAVAVSSSTSWPVSMGQPRSSASTWTWSATGVAVASVSTYSGVA